MGVRQDKSGGSCKRAQGRQTASLGQADVCRCGYRCKPWSRELGAPCWHLLPNREKLEQRR